MPAVSGQDIVTAAARKQNRHSLRPRQFGYQQGVECSQIGGRLIKEIDHLLQPVEHRPVGTHHMQIDVEMCCNLARIRQVVGKALRRLRAVSNLYGEALQLARTRPVARSKGGNRRRIEPARQERTKRDIGNQLALNRRFDRVVQTVGHVTGTNSGFLRRNGQGRVGISPARRDRAVLHHHCLARQEFLNLGYDRALARRPKQTQMMQHRRLVDCGHDIASADQCLYFAGKRKAVRLIGKIERLYPHRVTNQRQRTVVAVPECSGEYAVEPRKTGRSVAHEQPQKHL